MPEQTTPTPATPTHSAAQQDFWDFMDWLKSRWEQGDQGAAATYTHLNGYIKSGQVKITDENAAQYLSRTRNDYKTFGGRDYQGSVQQRINTPPLTAEDQNMLSGKGKTPPPAAAPADVPLDLNVTPQDRQLVEQSIGAAGDIARRQLEMSLPTILGQVSAQAGAQGLTGGSAEGAGRGIAGAQAVRSIADLLSQQQGQGAQALLNLPLQRAGLQTNQYNANTGRMLGLGNLELGRQGLDVQRQGMQMQQQQNNNAMFGSILSSVLPYLLA